MTDPIDTLAPRIQAAHLFWRGFIVAEVSRELDVPYSTVDSWRKADKWESAPVYKRTEACTSARLNQLIAKSDKSAKDWNEIDKLGAMLERTARMQKHAETGKPSDLNPKLERKNSRQKKAKPPKNYLTEDDIIAIDDYLDQRRFPHQKKWVEDGLAHAIRFILKSRQIGATDTFAGEALQHAIRTGKDQIFISASKAQAHVFKRAIINIVREACGIELKGDPITLGHNGATLHFLGTNKNTAQSYSGDLYIDEVFWIQSFKDIEHVASGMAVLDDRRITYFSTPSSTAHQAYPLWTGEHYNLDRPKSDHINLNVTHKELKDGKLCADGIYRQVITIQDAIDSGYNLVTLEKLRKKFAPSKFSNLFECQFVSDHDSIFKLTELQRCMVDSWSIWEDYKPMTRRPLGNQEVWIGYDPSRSGDDASLAVIAPPSVPGGKFRVVESMSFNDMDFDRQARKIKACMKSYNVTKIAIDQSGIGYGVYELVKKFFPRVKGITYNVEVKNALVLKAKQIISHAQIEWDQGDIDIPSAFMTIHQSSTAAGGQITYRASRTASTGHADIAWAIMHALSFEGLQSIEDVGSKPKRSSVEII